MPTEGSRQTAGQDVPLEAEVPLSNDGEGTTTPSPGAAGAAAGQPRGRVGDYEILGLIGEGGMGTVFRARQERPRREVALKLVRAGFASEKLRRRFEHEAEVLGRLQHDGIARIYEAGIDPTTNQPFFAMELIEGERLDEWAERVKPDLGARLRMVVGICEAVHYAHTKGVIHRDLKPANILITREGKPKILDFGVARLTDADATLYTRETQTGQVLGTLAYMSPEQAAGQVEEIDTRSDVYALGVIAYELLSGKLPLAVAGKPLAAAARVIAEEEPSRLSSVDRNLRGDVETIVGKALAKEKEARYDSAASLAGDIKRYLDYEPITARPPSTWYNLRKFARRNKAVVGGVAASFLILLAGAATSTVFAIRASQQAELAAQREMQAKDAADLAEQRRIVGETRETEAKEAREAEQQRADELEKVAAFQASQLEEIDPAKMGADLREGVLEEARAAMARARLEEDEIEQRVKALDESLYGANFTNLALAALEKNVFEGALAAIERDFGDQPLVKARLLQTASDTLRVLGLLERATLPQVEALAIRQQLLGDESADTLVSTNNLGVLLRSQGKLAEAEAYYRDALARSRRVRGEEHPQTFSLINNLGEVHQAQGRLAEAEQCYRECLEGQRRLLGDEHPDTLFSLNNMAGLLLAQGGFAEAERCYREVLEKRRRLLGEHHLDTVVSISDVGAVLLFQGEHAEAEPYFREALRKSRSLLGDEHPNTLIFIDNMGAVLTAQGKFAEAAPYMIEALEKSRRLLGEAHQDTITCINNMAVLLKAQGRLTEAEPYYREALEKSRHTLGEDHPDTLSSMNNMGTLLQDQGRFEEAEKHYRVALGHTERILGEHHPQTLRLINNLGSVLQAQGRHTEAEPYLREALKKWQHELGEAHSDTIISAINLCVLLQQQGKLQEAIGLIAPFEPRARKAFIAGNRFRFAKLLASLGLARLGLGYDAGRFSLAESNLLEAREIWCAAHGENYEETLDCVKGLADLYTAWHAAEPEKGYDVKAAEWRAKLESLQASTRPATQPSTSPATQPATSTTITPPPPPPGASKLRP